MKKIIAFIAAIIALTYISAVEINLKYSTINNNLEEVNEYIVFFKCTLNLMESWDLDYIDTKAKLEIYIDSLDSVNKNRIAYLDRKISYLYPEYYAEFQAINSRLVDPTNNNLYSDNEIKTLSIYHSKKRILPDILHIRDMLWKSLIIENPELSLFSNINYLNCWAVVKFIRTERVPINHAIALSSIYAHCEVVNSPFTELIGNQFKIAIPTFGSVKEFSLDKEYLINFEYFFLRRPEVTSEQSEISINDLRRYSSSMNRIYELSLGKIVYNSPTTIYNNNYWHPLVNNEFVSSKELFTKIKQIVNDLELRGIK